MSNTLQLDERIERCKKILQDNPRSQIFAALGDAFRKKGDLEKAYQITKRGLELHPDYGSGHVVMASIYSDRKLYHEAEKELDLAVKLDGKTRATEKLLAEVWLKKGELDKAQEALLRLRETSPMDESVNHLLKLARNLKDRGANHPEIHIPTRTKTTFKVRTPVQIVEAEPPEAAVPDFFSWAQVADYLKNYPCVQGVFIVGADGLTLEFRGSSQIPSEAGPLGLSVAETVRQNLPKIDYGKLEQVLVETAAVKIWIWGIKSSYLVLWAEQEINLGSLKMRISQVVDKIAF